MVMVMVRVRPSPRVRVRFRVRVRAYRKLGGPEPDTTAVHYTYGVRSLHVDRFIGTCVG